MKCGGLFTYVSFWLTARSRLDIHSPFVYQIYANVLKDKGKYQEYHQIESIFPNLPVVRHHRLLFQFSRYLKPGNIWFHGEIGGVERAYLEKGQPSVRWLPMIPAEDEKFDLCFIDLVIDTDRTLKSYAQLLQHIHKESVIIAWNLRQTRSSLVRWKELKMLPKVTVTVDLFQVGLVFFNDNLSREEFRLRF